MPTFYVRARYPDNKLVVVADPPRRLGWVVEAISDAEALDKVESFRAGLSVESSDCDEIAVIDPMFGPVRVRRVTSSSKYGR